MNLVKRCSIYRQFESCPEADTETGDPDYLTVPLMTHQRQALTWLIWREQQKPSGGILGNVLSLACLFTLNSVGYYSGQWQSGVGFHHRYSVCLHDMYNDAARITKLNRQLFHDESWKLIYFWGQKVIGQGHITTTLLAWVFALL